MYRFFVDECNISDTRIVIAGSDFNHIKNVLRMKPGENIQACTGDDKRVYDCIIESFSDSEVLCTVTNVSDSGNELPVKIYLFQGLPKQDKMELIVQKAVELGAYEIVPTVCHRSIVKLDEKKARSKTDRWNQISLSAAKQAKRSYIPVVERPMSYKEALKYAKDNGLKIIIPYEKAEAGESAMDRMREFIGSLEPSENIGIFIGPEGGFEESEVLLALSDYKAIEVTLGSRILRTETAGMMMLSWLVLGLDGKE